jgi:hypothetical protein
MFGFASAVSRTIAAASVSRASRISIVAAATKGLRISGGGP